MADGLFINVGGTHYYRADFVEKVHLSNTFAIGELIKHHVCPDGAKCVNPNRFVTGCDTCWRNHLNQRVQKSIDSSNL